MAPARMVQFIKQHAASCPVCKDDPDIQDEIEKITEIILPESKIPKAVRMKQELDDEDDFSDDDNEDEDESSNDDEDDDETTDDDSDLEDDEFSEDEESLKDEDEDDF